MKMINLLKKIAAMLGKKEAPLEVRAAAFHEAGHIVYAYFAQWQVREVILDVRNGQVINGVTRYDFGGERTLVQALTDDQLRTSLTAEQFQALEQIATRRCLTLIGGPVAEAYFYKGINYEGEIQIDFRGPDMSLSYHIEDLVFNLFGVNQFVQQHLQSVLTLTKHTAFWASITAVASNLLKNNYQLSQQEIEQILTDAGFLAFCQQNRNQSTA